MSVPVEQMTDKQVEALSKKSHPAGLYSLFFTEMWERFSYYGMRAMLVLYLVNQIGTSREYALEVYGIFSGLVYFTPLIGGYLADKVLGNRKSIFIGGILMAMGQFALATSPDLVNLGLGFLIIGNGFFKPNISSMVGDLYSDTDPRKDSAFTIFYMGINIGALSPFLLGPVRLHFGFSIGFALAGFGMLLGLLWFWFRGNTLGHLGFPPNRQDRRFILRDLFDVIGYVVVSVLIVYGGLSFWSGISQELRDNLKIGMGIVGAAALIYVVARNTAGGTEWSRVGVIFILCLFNIFFWAGFEQAGGTFNLFADEHVQRKVGSFVISTEWFQIINALIIIIMATPISQFWVKLGKLNPNIPVKFSLGLMILGLGFVVMVGANNATHGGTELISPLWLVGVYFVHSIAELCLSPIGLSMISKLSPSKITSVMMGVWFFSTAIGNYYAGTLEKILNDYHLELYQTLIISSIASGLVLLALSPILKRMMKGIV